MKSENKEKIAILTDSCCDVPKELVEQYHMYVLPLKIVYKNKEYSDGVDITPQEVYDRIKEEIPTTSLPSGDVIKSRPMAMKRSLQLRYQAA